MTDHAPDGESPSDHADAAPPAPTRRRSLVWWQHLGLLALAVLAIAALTSSGDSFVTDDGSYELQLRALEDGMRIDVAIVDSVPLGVDTPADLERARQILASD